MLLEIRKLQLEVEQDRSETMSKTRKERELRVIQTVFILFPFNWFLVKKLQSMNVSSVWNFG